MLDIGAVEGALQGYHVDDGDIEEICAILRSSASSLDGSDPKPIADSVFGGSSAGGMMGFHTSVAHRHVAQAMADMMAGLEAFEGSVRRFAKEAHEVDDNSRAASERLTTRLETTVVPCTSAPDLTANNACTLPADGDDGR